MDDKFTNQEIVDMDLMGEVFFRRYPAGEHLTMTMIRERCADIPDFGSLAKQRGRRIIKAVRHLTEIRLIEWDEIKFGDDNENDLVYHPTNDIRGWMQLREEATNAANV